uniref:ORF73 n=1 Tax=Malaco herpesvirus 1 TaxID=3031797 RepID=A0AA48P7T1_9VIRU|nr:TPA_asm: ORF73 [Malaco herpesvirus 1]
MGKIKSSKGSSFWSMLGVKQSTNFKNNLILQHKRSKESKKAFEMSFVDKSRQPKCVYLPTPYLKIEENDSNAINRRALLTANMMWTSMMTDKELTNVTSDVENLLGSSRPGSLIDHGSRVIGNMDSLYTASYDAVAHLIGCMDDEIMKVLLLRATQFLSESEDRSLRVFLDDVNPETKERYVSFQTSFNPQKGADVGSDLLTFVKLVNLTTQVKGSKISQIGERVRFRVFLTDFINNKHDLEGITFNEFAKRTAYPIPITGKPFVKKSVKSRCMTGHKSEEKRIVFELIVNLPPVENFKRIEIIEQIKTSHKINSVVQCLQE